MNPTNTIDKLAEINWCDCCRTPIAEWGKVSCFIPKGEEDYGPHPRPDDWGKQHRRHYMKNDGRCGCGRPGFPYCERHDAP